MIVHLNIPPRKQEDALNIQARWQVDRAEIALLMRLLDKYRNNIAIDFADRLGGMYSVYCYEDWKRITHKMNFFCDLMDVDREE